MKGNDLRIPGPNGHFSRRAGQQWPWRDYKGLGSKDTRSKWTLLTKSWSTVAAEGLQRGMI